MERKKKKQAEFRFYEELNDFLPAAKKKCNFTYHFNGRPSVKDAIEANNVPHIEVDLIVVNGKPVEFNYILQEGDRVPARRNISMSFFNAGTVERFTGKALILTECLNFMKTSKMNWKRIINLICNDLGQSA